MEGTITVRNMASRNHTIATLGSHCALQLLKGAKDEGLRTLLVCEKKGSISISDLDSLMIFLSSKTQTK